jgi:hypothetical protein
MSEIQNAATGAGRYDPDFRAVFDDRIAPLLTASAEERRARIAKGKRLAAAIVVIGFAVSAVGVVALSEALVSALVAGVMGMAFTIGIAYTVVRRADAAIDRRIAEEAAVVLADHAFGGRFDPRPAPGFIALDRFDSLKVLAWGQSTTLRGGVTGTWRDIGFRMVAARRTRRTRSGGDNDHDRTRVVFAGLLLLIEVPREMPAIVIQRRRGAWLTFFSSAPRPGMRAASLGDEGFDSAYELWTDDPEGAPARLGPAFGALFVDLARHLTGRPTDLAAAFDGARFFLAVPGRGDFLNLSSRGLDVEAFARRCSEALEDMRLPCRIIDALTGAR